MSSYPVDYSIYIKDFEKLGKNIYQLADNDLKQMLNNYIAGVYFSGDNKKLDMIENAIKNNSTQLDKYGNIKINEAFFNKMLSENEYKIIVNLKKMNSYDLERVINYVINNNLTEYLNI